MIVKTLLKVHLQLLCPLVCLHLILAQCSYLKVFLFMTSLIRWITINFRNTSLQCEIVAELKQLRDEVTDTEF